MIEEIRHVLEEVERNGGKAYIVGGYVRDMFLHLKSKDCDIEVYRMSFEKLKSILERFGSVKLVGEKFVVLHFVLPGGMQYDFSLPRRDSKQGKSHADIQAVGDPRMTMKEAARRRDVTANSMALNWRNGKVYDPFGGRADIRRRILHPTSKAFAEDPLRGLRALPQSGRFEMSPDQAMVDACIALVPEYQYLTKERIWEEWEKWARLSVKPSMGLNLLWQTEWIYLYPELSAMLLVPQDPDWHPEGNNWDHTLHVVDQMAGICYRKGIEGEERQIRMFAALLHDTGKPETTEFIEGHWRSRGHEEASEVAAISFLKSIMPENARPEFIDVVSKLISRHLAHLEAKSAKSVRRLSRDIYPATLTQLVDLIEADQSGRPPLPRELPKEAEHMLEIAVVEKVTDSKPEPILMGRHLIEMFGQKPGPHFKQILNSAYEAQLDGAFADVQGATIWYLNRPIG